MRISSCARSCSPPRAHELTYPGGSVEHWNEEPGVVWLERLTRIYEHAIWLNPVPERHWEYTPLIQIMKQILSDRMYPLTLEGLDKACES